MGVSPSRATPGILANATPRVLIGGRGPARSGCTTKVGAARRLCSTTTAQPQLAIASSASAVSSGQSEHPGERDPQGGAVHHDDGGLPRRQRSRTSRVAGTIRAATSSTVSAPGTSTCAWTSDRRVRPPPASRRTPRGSGRCARRRRTRAAARPPSAVSPVSFSRNAAVSRARARSLLTSSAGSKVGEHGRHRLGLAPADVVQADVGVPLGAALGVPGGLTVPHEDACADPTGARRRLSDHGRR